MVVAVAPRIVGVRFYEVGKLYHFDSSAYPEVRLGDYVIVETSRGRQMGQVMGLIPPERADLSAIKPIKRLASARDLMMRKLYQGKQAEALVVCRETAADLGGLEEVKFVRAEYSYDGSTLAFLYTAEENIDLTRLRRRLTREFPDTRVDLRRIGARDAARLLGEYGACGELRCCSTHLTDFSPISIKMAKAQGISLNPTEITGMCGRLRCCLIYEYEQYVEARKHLPKIGKIIGTPHGEGKVVAHNPLMDTLTVQVEETRYEIGRDEVLPLEELRALEQKAASGCAREGGPCECGARIRPEAPADAAWPAEAEAGPPAAAEEAPRREGGRRRSKRRRPRRSGGEQAEHHTQ